MTGHRSPRSASRPVDLVEVGPRDGLQNEAATLDTATKVGLIGRLVDGGVRRIEVASFVSPRLVPQMADAEAVCAALPESDDVSYIGLVLNDRGLDRALATGVHEINFVVGASEGFNRANQGASREETMAWIEQRLPSVAALGRRTTVTISVAFGCPFEGEVAWADVVALAGKAASCGAGEVALGDTIGAAVPADVTGLVQAVGPVLGEAVLRCHFHDTRNTAIANAAAAMAGGVGVLDSSVGGVGGCPFAPAATGNLATEDLLYLLDRSGIETGMDHGAMIAIAGWLNEKLGRVETSALARAGWFPGAGGRGPEQDA